MPIETATRVSPRPGANLGPEIGDFVSVRGRRWLVEGGSDLGQSLHSIRLACVDDDAQGEILEIAWQSELDAQRLSTDSWSSLSTDGTDDPAVFAAYLRTLEWNTATAADRDLFQAPFRAGIKAGRLPTATPTQGPPPASRQPAYRG